MGVTFSVKYYKNDGGSDSLSCSSTSKAYLDAITSVGLNWGEPGANWSREGYTFVEWNTSANGSGTGYQPGDVFTGSSATVYAIWESLTPKEKVIVSLGDTKIASLSTDGSITLATKGTQVKEDITISYES